MNKWKVSFFVCLSILILSSFAFLYAAIDQGVSYTYLELSYNDSIRSKELLGELIVEGSKDYDKSDVLHLLRQAKPDAFIVEEENKIIIEQVVFEFSENRLVSVN